MRPIVADVAWSVCLSVCHNRSRIWPAVDAKEQTDHQANYEQCWTDISPGPVKYGEYSNIRAVSQIIRSVAAAAMQTLAAATASTCFLPFYPRDAMLARVLAIDLCLCLSVCLCMSATSRCSINMDGRMELIFGTWASFDLSYTGL